MLLTIFGSRTRLWWQGVGLNGWAFSIIARGNPHGRSTTRLVTSWRCSQSGKQEIERLLSLFAGIPSWTQDKLDESGQCGLRVCLWNLGYVLGSAMFFRFFLCLQVVSGTLWSFAKNSFWKFLPASITAGCFVSSCTSCFNTLFFW